MERMRGQNGAMANLPDCCTTRGSVVGFVLADHSVVVLAPLDANYTDHGCRHVLRAIGETKQKIVHRVLTGGVTKHDRRVKVNEAEGAKSVKR